MKKNTIFMILISVIIFNACSQTHHDPYANGNGSIIEIKTDGNMQWIRRKHIQRIQIGDLVLFSNSKSLIVYDDPLLKNNIESFRLNLNDYINIFEVIKEEDTKNNISKIWLKISAEQENRIGWINIKDDPYENDRWSIIDMIEIDGRVWTVRKLESAFMARWNLRRIGLEAISIHENPGFGSTVICELILPEDVNLLTIYGIAITEEMDTIDGMSYHWATNHWVKIEYNQGKTGWIFGGYGEATAMFALWTPERIIWRNLGRY